MALNKLGELPNYPDGFKFINSSIGKIFNDLLPYIYFFAGLAMMIMLIIGGITLMTAAGDQGKTKDGYGKITAGIIGFVIIFISFFVVQLLEAVLGVKILKPGF